MQQDSAAKTSIFSTLYCPCFLFLNLCNLCNLWITYVSLHLLTMVVMSGSIEMSENDMPEHDRWDPEPRWPAAIAVIAVGGLYLALPSYLTVGPRWLFPAAVGALLVPTVITHRAGKHSLNRILGFTVTGLVTIGMIVSVILLIAALPSHKQSPTQLLISAAALWATNVLVFALWYWRLDAGGPHGRDSRLGHPDGAFLFPQMTIPLDAEIGLNRQGKH